MGGSAVRARFDGSRAGGLSDGSEGRACAKDVRNAAVEEARRQGKRYREVGVFFGIPGTRAKRIVKTARRRTVTGRLRRRSDVAGRNTP